MASSYHSVFLVPCVPFLCSIGSMFLVPVCWFVSLFIHWVVYRIVRLSIFGLLGISSDIPRYLRYRILPDTVAIHHDTPWHHVVTLRDLGINLLRWEPWYRHQGTAALGPCPSSFFYFIFLIFWWELIFCPQKNEKKHCFLFVFSRFLSLTLSFSVHTLWVLLSLINFTKVSCEGKLKKGVAYKL